MLPPQSASTTTVQASCQQNPTYYEARPGLRRFIRARFVLAVVPPWESARASCANPSRRCIIIPATECQGKILVQAANALDAVLEARPRANLVPADYNALICNDFEHEDWLGIRQKSPKPSQHREILQQPVG